MHRRRTVLPHPDRRPLVVLAVALALAGPAAAQRPAARTATFAGGCFWGVESVFEHVRGVRSATSGFATSTESSAAANGTTGKGFAEAVRVVYDPSRVSYDQLLEVFFLVAHDPTQLDRQGPDVGVRYRSIVFVGDETERRAVAGFLHGLRARRAFPRPIVTEVATLDAFRVAEDAHQDFARRNPDDPYVLQNDVPKIEALRRTYPALYRE